jgi:hypothetical protein
MRLIRLAALTLALGAALSPALLPHSDATWDRTETGMHIPLIGALSNPSIPAVPVRARETVLALSLSLQRYRPPADVPDTSSDRYAQSLLAVAADPEIGAAKAEIENYDQAVAAHELTAEYRQLLGSSLMLLLIVAVVVFALRTYRLGHRRVACLLLAGAVAFGPLAIPLTTDGRILVPVLRFANMFPTRRVNAVWIESLDLPTAPAGEVWSHASLEEARPAAVARIAETARFQNEYRPMLNDDAVAKRQLLLSFALAAAAAFISLTVWSRRRLSRWHPVFRSYFPTLWPKDSSEARSDIASKLGARGFGDSAV